MLSTGVRHFRCREVITSRLEKGEHFSNVFRWIDGVRYGEARVASAADNVRLFETIRLCIEHIGMFMLKRAWHLSRNSMAF